MPEGYIPDVGHWEKCIKYDYECQYGGDVCCPSKKTFSSDDQVMLCGPAERKTVTSGIYSGWKYKCPEEKIADGAKWLSMGSGLISIALYQMI